MRGGQLQQVHHAAEHARPPGTACGRRAAPGAAGCRSWDRGPKGQGGFRTCVSLRRGRRSRPGFRGAASATSRPPQPAPGRPDWPGPAAGSPAAAANGRDVPQRHRAAPAPRYCAGSGRRNRSARSWLPAGAGRLPPASRVPAARRQGKGQQIGHPLRLAAAACRKAARADGLSVSARGLPASGLPGSGLPSSDLAHSG